MFLLFCVLCACRGPWVSAPRLLPFAAALGLDAEASLCVRMRSKPAMREPNVNVPLLSQQCKSLKAAGNGHNSNPYPQR